MEFLDISLLSYSSIPERYRFKFGTDFKKRKGYEYQPPKREGGTFVIK